MPFINSFKKFLGPIQNFPENFKTICTNVYKIERTTHIPKHLATWQMKNTMVFSLFMLQVTFVFFLHLLTYMDVVCYQYVSTKSYCLSSPYRMEMQAEIRCENLLDD